MSDHNTGTTIKEIPYGITDYELIHTENYYYVDKTMYLDSIKKSGRYLFFIRPRRFGKSLFLSLMESYYDVLYKEKFEELFKGTWIYDNPTDDRGCYLILKFNFSLVNPAIDLFEESFIKQVIETALYFIRKYSQYLQTEDQLHRYSKDEKFKRVTGNTTPVKLVLIFSGSELIYIGEAK